METLIYKYTLFAVVMLALIPEVIISGKSWREGMYSAKPLHLFLSISLILNSLAWSHTIANDVLKYIS